MNSSDPVDNDTPQTDGPETGTPQADSPLIDEVRKLAAAVGEQAERVFGRVKADNPEVFEHLAAAGGELLAAYRAAVSNHERRWSAPEAADSEPIDLDG